MWGIGYSLIVGLAGYFELGVRGVEVWGNFKKIRVIREIRGKKYLYACREISISRESKTTVLTS